ncbi:MAG TPA: response regulator transcription factor [Polyangiaceae bacterium]|nr:response regulator transcription factor [Polyangiaceae bacterium]
MSHAMPIPALLRASVPLRIALVEADYPVPSPARDALRRLPSVLTVEPSDDDAPLAIVVDVGRDLRGGCTLVRAMAAAFPRLAVLALLDPCDERRTTAALESGAHACLQARSGPEVLLAALEEICERVWAPQTSRAGCAPELSARELDVLTGIARGSTYKQIADVLRISPHTVHTHVRKLYEKLDASCREDALEAARRLGLLTLSVR